MLLVGLPCVWYCNLLMQFQSWIASDILALPQHLSLYCCLVCSGMEVYIIMCCACNLHMRSRSCTASNPLPRGWLNHQSLLNADATGLSVLCWGLYTAKPCSTVEPSCRDPSRCCIKSLMKLAWALTSACVPNCFMRGHTNCVKLLPFESMASIISNIWEMPCSLNSGFAQRNAASPDQ